MKKEISFSKLTFFGVTVLLIVIGCGGISSIPQISATNPKIGIETQADGHVIDTLSAIPADIDKVFLEFYLDIPDRSKIPLEIKWFYKDQIVYTLTDQFQPGYTIATLERDPDTLSGFPTGAYSVEVWFLNTMLTSTSFDIR